MTVERSVVVMGTTLYARADASDRATGLAALELALAAVRRVDDLLSTWRDDSEIARLNAGAPGAPMAVSRELESLLAEALQWSAATQSAFDPAIGAWIDAWDLRGAGRVPTDSARARAGAASGARHFRILPGGGAERLHGEAWLDTGAFGKGAALRAARSALASAGVTSAFLNFGGQVLAIGRPDGEPGWRVPVAHPGVRDSAVAMLRLRDRSASTSSQSERFVRVDGRRFGHLIDPRTGEPAPAWGSVTVIADDAAVADILSTALFIMGPESGLRWAEARGIAALFLVDQEGGVLLRSTGAAETYLDPAANLTSKDR